MIIEGDDVWRIREVTLAVDDHARWSAQNNDHTVDKLDTGDDAA